MLSHHLTDETLQDYAAGVLNQSMETLIACHLTVCPACRTRSDAADGLGGVTLNAQPFSALNVTADDILALDGTLNIESASSAQTDEPKLDSLGVPRPLGRLLPSSINTLPWKTFGPGMKQYSLGEHSRKDGVFKLFSLAPGSKMSAHTHEHRELTFIVSGSYTDDFGHFTAGDVADLSADHHHTPIVDSDEPCICLIATDAPVKFDGLVGKVMQPFVGI